ncbi:MAG: 50S ribosomal protein L25 [Candidatus Saganbacteria bacterium]|nr:50S ribosomal protein L25 [Candidatus Saganbacteria bacterium]
MDKVELEVKLRKDKPNRVRNSGAVPAVIYGKDFETLSVEVDAKKMSTLFGAGSNKNVLITLKVHDGKKLSDFPVLAHEIQTNALNDNISHIDFLRINMKEEIKTKVSVISIGEATGVKLDGGILVQALRQIEVKCLPADIPGKIEIDVTALKIGDSIHVGDITPPKGVTITSTRDDVVITVTMPTKEEEVAPVAAAVVEGVVTEEGAVPAEGAAAVEGAEPQKDKDKDKEKVPAEAAAKAKAPQKPSK